ncbi:cyclin-dependent kinase G-2 isoform X2 [Magnolia sinica]|uniref:cyclin-dependent kinase G-2 isoform X2 n=1 Tax=Magnolia sinica TaxID=86752 RepID=UPI002658C25B|nr:cyclin-dependent kinase G-2 isoform X2 [Magnolia sinica]
MAAGRHGGFRDHEPMDRESDLRASRRRDFYKEEYSRFRDGAQERGRNRGIGDLEQEKDYHRDDRVRVRQRDIKERETVNGGYRSSSSMSDSGSSGNSRRPVGFSVRMADREPGELSSGSESDDVEVSEPQVRDNGNWKSENGALSPLGRKRKFSPIVWDREEKQVSISSRSKTTDSAGVPLPPPPPLPQGFRRSPYPNLSDLVHPSPVKSDSFSSKQSLHLVEPLMEPVLAGSAALESPYGSSPAPSHEVHWSNNHEPGQLEDEDYAPTRNISASRWADENNSPKDEGEVSDEEAMLKRRKKMPVGDLVDMRLNTKVPSPELGELIREGSEGARVKPDSEKEGRRIVPASEDEYQEIDLDKNDFMEVDEEDVNDDDTGDQAEMDSEEENDSIKTPEPTPPLQRSINMLQGCRSVDEFERLNKIDEGTYGVVYRAKDKKTGEIVALKKVKMEKEREGFPLTSLREINILLSFYHPSIVDVKEVVVGSSLDSIFMVMEYMEHDLKGLMETMKQPFSQSEVKCLMLQLLEGVKYLHDNWVLHRDLKTSNLLLNNRGELKICDFGLSRQYGSPLKPYTHLVVTLWYRAPELLLGAKQYSTAIDMWSLGCIMAELLAKEPLFNGKTEFDQLDKIFRTLGTPSAKIWPEFVELPGVKVNFVKQPLPAMGDAGITSCVISSHPHLSLDAQPFLRLDLTY